MIFITIIIIVNITVFVLTDNFVWKSKLFYFNFSVSIKTILMIIIELADLGVLLTLLY